MNHERRTLKIRNPGRPGREVLPCKLTLTELEPRWGRVGAIEQQVLVVESELAAAKSKAKAALDKLAEERATLWKQIAEGTEDRTCQVEYLVDEGQSYMYAFRLDEMKLVRRRELTKQEKLAATQGDLFAKDAPTRTLDVPEDLPTVRRFDSDTPDVGQDEPEPAATEDGVKEGGNGHECTFNEGSCGKEEPADPGAAKKGRKGKGKGYDTRGVAAH